MAPFPITYKDGRNVTHKSRKPKLVGHHVSNAWRRISPSMPMFTID